MRQAVKLTAACTAEHHLAVRGIASLLPLLICTCHCDMLPLCRQGNLPQATHPRTGCTWLDANIVTFCPDSAGVLRMQCRSGIASKSSKPLKAAACWRHVPPWDTA